MARPKAIVEEKKIEDSTEQPIDGSLESSLDAAFAPVTQEKKIIEIPVAHGLRRVIEGSQEHKDWLEANKKKGR